MCPEIPIKTDECVDSFMEGRLKLIQSKDGYRFSVDAVLLSAFATVRPGDVVVDLGTGCGVIPLILLLTRPVERVYGLEIQKGLADQAYRNARINGFEKRMDIIMGDIRHPPLKQGSADLVICNPPYRRARSGRLNPDPRRAIARHEILASMEDILRGARGLLKKKGRCALVYPAVRLVDILAGMRRNSLEPKRVRINYTGPESEAKLVLIEAVLNGRPGLEIEPALLGQGDYSIPGPTLN